MNNAELKKAMKERVPVRAKGINYLRIRNILYTMPDEDKGNEITVSIGLLDRNRNSVTYVEPDKVELLEDKGQ